MKSLLDYKSVVIPKPWGEEYLLFQTSCVAGWILRIKKGEKTSLHCHPNKKTSLVVLSGKVNVYFLTSKLNLSYGEKVIIRQGVFHSTEALTDNVILLEVETPVDKEDLLRIKDSYGRESKPYETITIPRQNTDLFLVGNERQVELCKNVNFSFLTIKDLETISTPSSKIFVFLELALFRNNIVVTGQGDALTEESYKLLSLEFSKNYSGKVLMIEFYATLD